MSLNEVEFQELVDFYDHVRIPLSGMEREKRQGRYRYYGAQSVIDHVDDFLFDGEYVLIAEDGANLVTRNEPIAQVVSGQFWVNNHAHIVQAKEGVSTNNFINYLINTNNISGYVTGAAQPKLSQKNLRVIKFEVPSYEDQIAIDELISKYDDLIENNKRRIELLEESARQLYKEWFVRFRFPGHEHVKIIDGVPEGWTAGCVGDTAKLFSGYAFKSKDWLEEGNPVIKIKNITSNNTVDVSDCQCVDDNVAEKAAKFKLSAGDMLIAMTGATVGKVGLMPISERTFYLNQRVGKFESKIGRDVTPLLLSFFNSEKAQSSILNLAGGAAQPNISAKQIESIELPIPPETLLNTFLDETENLFTLRLNLVDQIFRLTQARDLLLPKLMNGEIAV